MIYDYIIIGAGISGLYNAYLLDKKYSVLVLEKNDYIGGRIKEVKFHNTIIKLGAGVSQGKNINVLNLLKLLKVPYTTGISIKSIITNINDFNINHFNINDFNINNAIKLIKAKYTELDKSLLYKMTFGQFLEKYFGKKFKLNYIKHSGYTDFINSDITYHIKYYPIEDHLTKDNILVYLKWSDLINKLKQNLTIKLNTNVINVYRNDYFCVNTKDTTYYSRKIIFALSIKPLNHLIKNLHTGINYKKYIGVVKYMRIYTYHKNGHNFKNDQIKGYNILVDKNPLQKIIIISDKILMASYCDGANALYWNTMPQGELKNTLLYWLRKIEHNTTEIDDVLCKFWDEGVHYYKPHKHIKNMIKKLQNPGKDIYVVGEVVSFRHGWVEGAISSVNIIYKKMHLK